MTLRDALVAMFMLLAGIAVTGYARAEVRSDVIDFRPPQSSAEVINTPRRGQTMGVVQTRFGRPARKHAPVSTGGNPLHPPITRWDYNQFSVFFEHDKVLHSVIPDQTPRVYR